MANTNWRSAALTLRLHTANTRPIARAPIAAIAPCNDVRGRPQPSPLLARKEDHIGHRQSDLIAIQLLTVGSELFSGDDLQNMLSEAVELFFHAQGSVTRAIQSVIDRMNKTFYEMNADWGYEGKQVLGSVNICVLHNDWIFVGQIGDAFIYHVGDEKVRSIWRWR